MSLDSLVARVRLEFHDLGVPFQASVVGDGDTQRFELPVTEIEASSVEVYIEEALVASTEYTLDATNGVVLFDDPPLAGNVVVVQGVAYSHFADDDLAQYVNDAFLRHTHGQIPPVTLTTPTPAGYVALRGVEEPMVAWLATIDALWALAISASFDINITTPEGMMVPRGQRYQQILMMIQLLKERYDELAKALNVGVNRIQMFTLRRVSRTTNRLVPLYLPKEYDDITYPPTRVLPPIDPQVT